MLKKLAIAAALGLAAFGTVTGASAQQRAICYNCPPEWADWGSHAQGDPGEARHPGAAGQQELRPGDRRS
jgi:hypothetical protein